MEIQHGHLTELSESLGPARIDVFLGSASFESRCLSIPKHLDVSRVNRAIIGIGDAYADAVQPHIEQFEAMFGSRLRRLGINFDNPLETADNIASTLDDCIGESPRRILVDVTTFTREALLMTLAVLRARVSSADSVKFFYAHASEYSVGDPRESKWLSKGIRDVRSVLGFPGQMIPSRPSHLIVMMGFEDERAIDLIRECEPTVVSLGVGDEREMGTGPHQETNEHYFRRVRSLVGPLHEFRFKAYAPLDCRDSLKAQVRLHPRHNTIIAPMNTKISTIAAALIAFDDERVQLCYAPPRIYNVARYSTPDDDYYTFQLPGFP